MRDNDPHILDVIARERARDAENAAREYDAVFVDGIGTLLRAADVEDAIEKGIKSRPYRSDCAYGIVADVGLRRDSTVVLAFHCEQHKRKDGPPRNVLIVDQMRRLTPTLLSRVSSEDVEVAIASLAEKFNVSRVHADLHMADAIAPRLRARGLVFTEMSMSVPSQEKRAASMSARFSAGSVRLLDEPVLVRELKELKVTRSPGGRTSVGAPNSAKKHDDAADCLLLACEVATTLPAGGGNIECQTTVLRVEGGIDATSTWREKFVSPKGEVSWKPAGPPVGSPMWLHIRREQKAQGITVMGEPDIDDYDHVHDTLNVDVIDF